jgi:hypothetical protein
MNQLTTRELLYLEDMCKLFESTMKNCNFASNNAVDPEFKAFMLALATEHRQWIDATIPIVNGTRIQ